MTAPDPKSTLLQYLRTAREALLWKLEGLSEYDRRRPLVPTGTNLLGIIKHVATVEAGYLGGTFGRPFPEPTPWIDDDAESNADMWATAAESTEWVVDFFGRVAAHSEQTVAELELDSPGHVAWWPGARGEVTLHQILVHLIAEINRHAGHADVVRELIDGEAGLRADNSNLPAGDPAWWQEYRAMLERVAREAGGV